ncbi:5-(carboxyamino)imidazole ribonucleotide synthase [Caldalkalibacillus salinus]|uniref:5-(carboxyamino)imidazole ribonucleotide synthase n=1 Tax=Caldalkalibacillus salinus TaxID=2803787 RepID=UPI00192381EC|nr:5-(carboxyamino)imidazole ribonucleotide synthase [Caldalkalibacillus salinus]
MQVFEPKSQIETSDNIATKDQDDKHNASKRTLPPATIGILGGGQLGRMMALEAREMGYRIMTLDPTFDSPCAQVADSHVQKPFNSVEGAIELAEQADIITYEFENISAEVAHHLEKTSHMPQGYRLLYATQNRIREKQAIEKAGVKVAPYYKIQDEADLHEGLEQLDYPAVLKTTEGGYDGKGQLVIRAEEDLLHAIDMVRQSKQPLVLEQWVAFEKEISVVIARNPNGEVATFPVGENIHRENILHATIAPARISESVQKQALSVARKLAQTFELVGLLAIEMFVLPTGEVLVNELAPRPHNSGHYTQQGCMTSQFEQHVRAVCNLPLGATDLHTPTVMVNILGEHLDDAVGQLTQMSSHMKVHLYGKKDAKPKRKMGHLNVTANTIEEAFSQINHLQIWDPIE